MNPEIFLERIKKWKDVIIEAVDLLEVPKPRKYVPPCILRNLKIEEWPPSLETLDKWYRPDYDRFVEEAKAKKILDIVPYSVALDNLYREIKEEFPTIESIKETLRLEREYEKKRNKFDKKLKEAYSRVKETTEKHRLTDVFYHLEGKHSIHTFDDIDTVLKYITDKKLEYKLNAQGCTTFKAFLNETLSKRTEQYKKKYKLSAEKSSLLVSIKEHIHFLAALVTVIVGLGVVLGYFSPIIDWLGRFLWK